MHQSTQALQRSAWTSLSMLVRAGLPALVFLTPAAAEERGNFFDDPFLQVTGAIKECPVPEGPKITRAEMRAQSHWRAERGTSCFQSGRCRLPNSYLYDKEIIPRVKKAIDAGGRFSETSVWVEGQGRWVWLKGCVRRKEQASTLEQLVRGIDDVQAVVNELVVLGALKR
jgi:hypothetical protein